MTTTSARNDIEQEHVAQLLLLVQTLDHQHDDNGRGPDASTYRRVYEEAVEQLSALNPEDKQGLTGLRMLDGFISVEEMIRHAAFVQGFIMCSQLLTGTIQRPQVKR